MDGKGAPRSGIRPQAGGLRRGPWRIVHPDGLPCGEWPLRDPADGIVAGEPWCHGRSTGSGPLDEEDGPCGVTSPDACESPRQDCGY